MVSVVTFIVVSQISQNGLTLSSFFSCFFKRLIVLTVMVDVTRPDQGWVHDGQDPAEDIEFSSQTASVFSNWGDFHDPESGIDEYIVTLFVNGENREEFIMRGDEEYLEDHTQHLQHTDFVQVRELICLVDLVHYTKYASFTQAGELVSGKRYTTPSECRLYTGKRIYGWSYKASLICRHYTGERNKT